VIDPECLPSCKDLRPATPFRAPGSGLPRARGLATAKPVSRRLVHPRRFLSEPSRARSPSTRPVATGDTLLWTQAPLADFCNLNTTRGHTLRAFDPRTRVRLSPRYTPAPTDAGCVGPPVRRRTGSLRAATCTRRLAYDVFHCRGRDKLRAEALEQRRTARSWTISRVPFSWRLGHPGRRLDSQ